MNAPHTEAESNELLYRAYVQDRNGSRITPPMTHDQIHKDGVYGDLIDEFGERYAEERQAYLDERNAYIVEMYGEQRDYEPRF